MACLIVMLCMVIMPVHLALKMENVSRENFIMGNQVELLEKWNELSG